MPLCRRKITLVLGWFTMLNLAASCLAGSGATSRPTTAPDVEILKATLITLHLKDVAPKAAFAELARQAHTQIRTNPRALWDTREWPPITIDLERVSFWTAMKQLCEQTRLSPQRVGMEREIALTPVPGGRLALNYPGFEHGPFLITAQRISRNCTADLVAPTQSSRTCMVQLAVYAEPKVRVVKSYFNAQITQAVDDCGNHLMPPFFSLLDEHPQQASICILNIGASLTPPAKPGKTISILKGNARLLVQVRSDSVEIADILKARNVTRQLAGHKLLVKEVRKAGETYTFVVTVSRDPGQPPIWNDINLATTFSVLDASGQPLSRRNYVNVTNPQADHLDFNLLFAREDWAGPAVGEPAKLVWELPLDIKEIAVPFEFRDLVLP
jgi:hypothetical protein